MPRPKKKDSPVNPPASVFALSAPRLVCPFSGAPLQFVETAGGWQVRAAGWVSTAFYQTKEQAEWSFSFNEGHRPTYVPFWERIQVTGELEEPLPSATTAVEDALEAMDQIAEAVEKELSE